MSFTSVQPLIIGGSGVLPHAAAEVAPAAWGGQVTACRASPRLSLHGDIRVCMAGLYKRAHERTYAVILL